EATRVVQFASMTIHISPKRLRHELMEDLAAYNADTMLNLIDEKISHLFLLLPHTADALTPFLYAFVCYLKKPALDEDPLIPLPLLIWIHKQSCDTILGSQLGCVSTQRSAQNAKGTAVHVTRRRGDLVGT
ncbi:hypothetical protein L0F63_001941, partial [Massospora cicadina]